MYFQKLFRIKYSFVLVTLLLCTGCETMNQNLTSEQWVQFGRALADTVKTPDAPFTGAAPMRPVQQVQPVYTTNPYDVVNPQGAGF